MSKYICQYPMHENCQLDEKLARIAELQQANEALREAINRAGAYMSQGARSAAIDALSDALLPPTD